MEEKPVVTSAGEITITVSLGVAVSHGANSFDSEVLLHMADAALYRAKVLGRNRVELAVAPQLQDEQAEPVSPETHNAIKAESP